jgi:hypothetical protein
MNINSKKKSAFLLALVTVIFSLSSCQDPNPCGDLIVSKVTITQINGNYFEYDIEFKNIGAGTVSIDGNNTHPNIPGFQAYLSTNITLDNQDVAAGGNTVAGGPSFTLTTGQTYVRAAKYNPTNPVTITNYPYLILVITAPGSNDCNTTNNIAVKYIFPTNSLDEIAM